MKQGIIQLNPYATKDNTVESFVCFGRFIAFLEQKVKTDNGSRVQFYQVVLDKLRSIPELVGGMQTDEIVNYEEILDLVSAIVLPLADSEEETLLAFTDATSMEVFYATNAFFRMLMESPGIPSSLLWIDEKPQLELHSEFQYSLILSKIYGHQLPERNEMLHTFLNPVTGLYKYFRIHIDTRFVSVKVKPGMEIPGHQLISSCFDCSNPMEKVESVLLLENYIAKGFCIITLTDVTAQQAVEQIGKTVVRLNPDNTDSDFIRITRLLQTIVGSNQYQFGIMPFFSINKRAALPYENFTYSILIKTSFDAGISKSVFTRYINHYIKDPGWIIYESSKKNNILAVPVQHALQAAGIHYYTLAPVYFNDSLVGVFEIAAGKDTVPLNDLQASRLKPAVPYLSQLLMMAIEKFNVAIDTIIKDKFTNIQPSVQWKFNEVAWHYFRSHDIERKNSVLGKISFKNVHPLYGAVDIRNSTIERNTALREDLEFQLEWLIKLLTDLYENGHGKNFLQLAEKCRQWIEKMSSYVSVEEEMELNDFLFTEVHPLLRAVESYVQENLSLKIKAYYNAIDEENGEVYSKRRQLENSMQTLNKVVSRYFDLFSNELQVNYPCYFEKFRTDGIEYDIYIGQSIAPNIPFSFQHLEKLRLWQVQSMAAIAKLTHSLLTQLEYPLQTTQLIFVNARSIDISFRNDERRFDVEGAYNIRYHIVKKRIDKVHIKNTVERLTQPGKIAIVYFNEKDAAGYINNIIQLQKEHVLSDDLEHLELEELQGVAGLKALRVGVRLETEE